jgi:hypothetical protein
MRDSGMSLTKEINRRARGRRASENFHLRTSSPQKQHTTFYRVKRDVLQWEN